MGCPALHLLPSADGTDLNPKQGTDVSPSPQLARGTAYAGSLTSGCCPQHCSLGLSLVKAAAWGQGCVLPAWPQEWAAAHVWANACWGAGGSGSALPH